MAQKRTLPAERQAPGDVAHSDARVGSIHDLQGPGRSLEEIYQALQTANLDKISKNKLIDEIEQNYINSMLAIGVPPEDTRVDPSELDSLVFETYSKMQARIEGRSFLDKTDEEFINYLEFSISFHALNVYIYVKRVADQARIGLSYKNLLNNSAKLLTEKLVSQGWSPDEAARLSEKIARNFEARPSYIGTEIETIAVEFAASAIDVLRPPAIVLPSAAPEVWAERDRSKGETPIEFLDRVWKPWIEAGVLYQDDIKRLGDDKLVRAIRSYCQKHPEHRASDVLPPPRQARLDRALAEAPPDSPAARLIRQKIDHREAMARRRGKPRPS